MQIFLYTKYIIYFKKYYLILHLNFLITNLIIKKLENHKNNGQLNNINIINGFSVIFSINWFMFFLVKIFKTP